MYAFVTIWDRKRYESRDFEDDKIWKGNYEGEKAEDIAVKALIDFWTNGLKIPKDELHLTKESGGVMEDSAHFDLYGYRTTESGKKVYYHFRIEMRY